MEEDVTLLCHYRETRSDEAFARLVRRHLNLVYFAALRRTNGNAPLAEDVTQAVFIALAHRSARVEPPATLAGWLYVATRHAAANAMRGEQRRAARERVVEPAALSHATADSGPDWERVRLHLDAALDELGEQDRVAVLLRFFEDQPFAAVGAALKISEDAARMRVGRALEKLRVALGRRGAASTASALALMLAEQAGATAPPGLASSISAAALAAGAGGTAGATVASGVATALAKSVFTMGTTAKILAGVGAVAALAGVWFAWPQPNPPAPASAATVAARPVPPDPLPAPPAATAAPLSTALAAGPAPVATQASTAPHPSAPKSAAATAAPPSKPAADPAALAAARDLLAHVGNIVRDGKIEPNRGLDAATVAVFRAWMEQDPSAAIQWLGTLPPEGNQRMHTQEALIAIELETDPETAFLLANSIGLETSRISRLRDVVRAWAPRDLAAATAAVQGADVSEEMRAMLLAFAQRESRGPH